MMGPSRTRGRVLMQLRLTKLGLGLAFLLLLHWATWGVVSAHTWIECLDPDRQVVFDRAREFIYGGPGAAGRCGGYVYDYRGRGEGILDDTQYVKILKADYLARPAMAVCRGSPQSYTGEGFGRRLRVAPGTTVFFAYMPNGHVAVDRAARGTLHGLYWTGTVGTRLETIGDLTDARLLEPPRRDFDDQVCGQTFANKTTGERSGRAGDDFPCVGQFTIPPATPPGIYSFVWMWKFWDELHHRPEVETAAGTYGGAAYSSCFDVEVTSSPPPP